MTEHGAGDASGDLHGVRHFWLCERCSHVFTLVHNPQHGIVLQLLWPELPLAESHKEFPAACHL